jgi:hypothetical protein
MFVHRRQEKHRNFYMVGALPGGSASGFVIWRVGFSDCLAFLAFLAVGSSSLNRQDAKGTF